MISNSILPSQSDIQSERNNGLPVWVKAPKRGLEYYTGLSRAKLYELAGEGSIESRSLRKPGQIKGSRLFNLKSILNHIENSYVTG
jgi:hypothetical protein